MSDLFADQERAANRKKKSNEIKQKASDIITKLLDKQPVPATESQAFYLEIDAHFRTEFKTSPSYLLARVTLAKEIQKINKLRDDPLPLPTKPLVLQRAKPSKGKDWLIEGQIVAEYASRAISIWSTQKQYGYYEALAWSMFSAILWGGLNDIQVLNSFFQSLLSRQPHPKLNNNLFIIPLEIPDKHYGNIYIKESETLLRSFMFTPDSLTLCWMTHLQKIQAPGSSTPTPTLEEIFILIFKLLQSNSTAAPTEQIRHLLHYASYHWEQLADVQIDQALAQIMVGHQNCCSLSNSEFEIFNTKKIEVPHKIELSLPRLLKGTIPTNLYSKKVDPPKKIARDVTKDIRQAIKNKDTSICFEELIQLYNDERITRLMKWIDHLLHLDSKESLKKSSVFRYLDAVAHPWLLHTFEADLSSYEFFDFETLYETILDDIETDKRRSYIAPLLGRFHKFQIDQFSAPFAPIPGGFDTQKHISARIISPQLYQHLLFCIEKATDISIHDQQVFKLIIILAYRTGLRREELIKLQLRDIEHGDEISFIIRPSAVGGIKSSSAERRIPVWALLKSDELDELKQFLYLRNKQTEIDSTMVFTTANSSFKLPSELPLRLLNALLQQIMPNHHYTFHSFRHTAISNIALILTAKESLIVQLTDYTIEECINIRTALLGHEHGGQDRWFALAQVAGHIGPQYSFESYIHFAQLIASHEISQATIHLPLQAFHNITRISTKKIADWAPKSLDKNLKCVHLQLVRDGLIEQLNTFSYQDNVTPPLAQQSISSDEERKRQHIYNLFDLFPDGNSSHLSFKDIHQVLQEYENGMPLEQSAEKRQIPFELASSWIERAQQLSQLKTQRGESLLISKPRLNSNSQIISPAMPITQKGLELVEEMIHQLPKLLQNTPDNLHKFLDIFFDKTNTSISEIRFKRHEDYKLNFFLKIGLQFISISNWRLMVPELDEGRQLKKTFDISNALSIQKDSYQGFSLSIQKSSGVLKYFCHMLAIVDSTYELPQEEEPV
ncbi:MAG: site-specific integrase [Gammaproteobacteria bacterium]|nr:site-specific integrase [Gammaproteobacteria bacterium]